MTTSYPLVRPAHRDEYDEVARVWMESWVSTGLDTASDALLTKLRDRVHQEVDNGWSLFVADDGGRLAAMLAIDIPKLYLDMLFVAVDGRVVKIAHAVPHDESIISSEVPVRGVIELQGGICEKLHLKVGDLAKWKKIS